MSPVLDYHVPPPRNPSGLMKVLKRMGPWWVRPSWLSLVLILLVIATIVALHRRPLSWRPGIARMTIGSGIMFNWADLHDQFLPMPLHDAMLCLDQTSEPII
jgi:hypothetical protein